VRLQLRCAKSKVSRGNKPQQQKGLYLCHNKAPAPVPNYRSQCQPPQLPALYASQHPNNIIVADVVVAVAVVVAVVVVVVVVVWLFGCLVVALLLLFLRTVRCSDAFLAVTSRVTSHESRTSPCMYVRCVIVRTRTSSPAIEYLASVPCMLLCCAHYGRRASLRRCLTTTKTTCPRVRK